MALMTVGVMVLSVVCWLHLDTWRLLARLARRPALSGRSARQDVEGMVSVQGRVAAAGKSLTAPLTDFDCVYFRLRIDYRGRRRSLNDFLHKKYDEQMVRFKISGEAASVLVEPAGARFILDFRKSLSAWRASETRSRLEKRYGRVEKAGKYRERSIAVGDEILVIGFATMSSGGLSIRGRPGAPFIIADRSSFVLRRRYAGRAALAGLAAVALLGWVIHLGVSP